MAGKVEPQHRPAPPWEFVRLYAQRFVARRDRYATQVLGQDGRAPYVAGRRPLTDATLRGALTGRLTVAVYPFGNSTTKWLVLDFDAPAIGPARAAAERLAELGAKPLREWSGRKGWHVWVLFQRPVANALARGIGLALCTEAEIFPAQDVTSQERPGNPIKLPLQRHLAGTWSYLVDERFEPQGDAWGQLERVELANGIELAKNLGVSMASAATKHSRGQTPDIMKPCVAELAVRGSRVGERNSHGYVIASECRRVGMGLEGALGFLASWNLRNEQPVPDRELRGIVASAFRGGPHEYGCRPEGKLRQVVRCIGTERCPYYRSLVAARRPG